MSNTHVESGPRMSLVASVLLSELAENWWLLLLRGLAAIAFGLITFFWPGITLVALTYLWGAYALVDGVVAIWAAFNASGGGAGPRWWLGLSGVVSILAGIVAFAYTGMTALVLLIVHRGVGDHHRGTAALCGGSTAQNDRKRVAARVERSALDSLRRSAHRLAEHWSAGRYLDDRLVRGPFRLPAHRPGVPAEDVQADLTALSARQR